MLAENKQLDNWEPFNFFLSFFFLTEKNNISNVLLGTIAKLTSVGLCCVKSQSFGLSRKK